VNTVNGDVVTDFSFSLKHSHKKMVFGSSHKIPASHVSDFYHFTCLILLYIRYDHVITKLAHVNKIMILV